MDDLGEVDLRSYRRVFVIGDIHGDVYALVKALGLTERVQFTAGVVTRAAECPDAAIEEFGPLASGMTVVPADQRDAIIFNGDLVDNVRYDVRLNKPRSQREVLAGVCGWADSEERVLEAVHGLHGAHPSLDVFVCIGNHDLASMVKSNGGIRRWCAMYSPSMHQERVGGRRHCTRARADMVYGYLSKPGLLRACLHLQGEGRHFFVCHGGLNDRWLAGLDHLFAHAWFNTYDPDFDRQALTPVQKINLVYRQLLAAEDSAEEGTVNRLLDMHTRTETTSPISCRPYVEGDLSHHPDAFAVHWQQLRAELGVQRGEHVTMVVAHTPQNQVRCVGPGGAPLRTDSLGLIPRLDGENALCYVDTGMGRAMDPSSHFPDAPRPVNHRNYGMLTIVWHEGLPRVTVTNTLNA